MSQSDTLWMQQAVNLAMKAQSHGEVPVGAILVSEDGKVLGQGWNQVIMRNDPCAHAEILALREAAASLKTYRLPGTTLYVTLEPCCMCAGALIHARISRLVFGARDVKAGATGSVFNLLSGSALNHKVQIDEGCLELQCSQMLSGFFKSLRKLNS